jgi:multidrug resistance efflux pump
VSRARRPAAKRLLGALIVAGCAAEEAPEWVAVERDDLVLAAEVTGSLRAVDSTPITPPPMTDRWDFKIAHLAEEGAEVSEGEPVVALDPADLVQTLEQMRNEADGAEKELERQVRQAAMNRKDEQLAVTEAEAALRRAVLKADQPEDLAASVELRVAELDREIAERSLEHARTRAEQAQQHDRATIDSLRERVAYYRGRVREIEESVARMRIAAPRDGTVIYPTSWRGDKKKVGDSVWRMETIVEIVTLDEMIANGDVDEADASRVRVGQRVTLRVDAHPDSDLVGEVASIANSVQQQSFNNPSRVVKIEVSLQETSGVPLRPGMRFRGRVETERVPGAVLVPAAAVFIAPEGPVAYRRTSGGHQRVSLELGRRNDSYIEVLGGLAPGDQVSRIDLERGKP